MASDITLRFLLHMGLHVAIPGLVARIWFRDRWQRAWLIMIATMVVDFDHLIAQPIFDAGRCSLGFHPLHTLPAIAGYVVLTIFPATRLVGLGLVIHMALDGLDCVLMGL